VSAHRRPQGAASSAAPQPRRDDNPGGGGWREIVDYARDLGRPVPGGQTRREDARSLGPLALAPLAASADSVVFGPANRAGGSAWYWSEVERTRREINQGLNRWQRLRAAVSLRSFRPPRRPFRVSNPTRSSPPERPD